MIKKIDLNKKGQELLESASRSGLEQNFFFTTTFKRYNMQLKILGELERVINSGSVLVTKEYVKGRENIYAHPAVGEYNKTASAANKTVETLMRIITTLGEHTLTGSDEDDDKL